MAPSFGAGARARWRTDVGRGVIDCASGPHRRQPEGHIDLPGSAVASFHAGVPQDVVRDLHITKGKGRSRSNQPVSGALWSYLLPLAPGSARTIRWYGLVSLPVWLVPAGAPRGAGQQGALGQPPRGQPSGRSIVVPISGRA